MTSVSDLPVLKGQSNTSNRLWLVLIAPPLLFLAAIVVASAYFGVANADDPEAIATQTTQAMPYILLVTQISLGLLLVTALRTDKLSLKDIGWQLNTGKTLWREVVIGFIPGAVLGLLYVTVLSPLLTLAQQTLGDYIPAGELLPTVGASLVPFFAANVLLAPFVEENLYRGYTFAHPARRFSPAVTLVVTCLFFGLLHWAGGAWYILLTGIVAGGLFGGLRLWRQNIVAPFAAHLALNLFEFIFVWLWISV